jgi:hypothetical protein
MKNPKTGKTIGSPKEKKGKLTTAGRLAIPKGKFALPAGPEEKRRGIKGRYPINDEAHARNALARVSQNGTPEEQRIVRAAVAREWPGIQERALHGGKRGK